MIRGLMGSLSLPGGDWVWSGNGLLVVLVTAAVHSAYLGSAGVSEMDHHVGSEGFSWIQRETHGLPGELAIGRAFDVLPCAATNSRKRYSLPCPHNEEQGRKL